MKKLLIALSLLVVSSKLSWGQIPVIASWVLNNIGAYGEVNGHSDTIESNVTKDQFDSNYVYISCNSIPGYNIGPWNANPNWAQAQNYIFRIPRNPAQNTGTLVKVPLGHIGIWKNGVSIFNAWDGMSYANKNIWDQNASVFEGASFDTCLGHPDQGGEYHHHLNPKCLYNDADSTHHSPIIGYAFDGFPIYGAYAYTNTNGTGAIKRMTSSYRLRTNMVNRDTLPDSTTALPPSDYGPTVGSSYPLGDYLQDYIYVAGSGDLDEHNGRFCITPEYPNGIYAYFVTIDANRSPVYPYVLGQTYYGTVPSGNTGPGSGHNTIPGPTVVYTSIPEIHNQIKFVIEPNPAKDHVNIYFDAASDNNIFGELFNANGFIVKGFKNMQPTLGYSIDLHDLPTGTYFFRLHTQNASAVQKIIKVK
jgi:hypothetical protein